MSAVTELLNQIQAAGIRLVVEGERLRYRPVDRMTPELAAAIRAHRTMIVAQLAGDIPTLGRENVRPAEASAMTASPQQPNSSQSRSNYRSSWGTVAIVAPRPAPGAAPHVRPASPGPALGATRAGKPAGGSRKTAAGFVGRVILTSGMDSAA